MFVFIFAFGAMIGSFLNVVIYRLPKKENFVAGSSYCPRCNHKLKALDLVPIASYLFLGRTCRYCKQAISPRYMLIEGLTGALAILSYAAFFPPAGFLLSIDPTLVFVAGAKEVGLLSPWFPVDLPASVGALIAAVMVFTLLCVLIVVTFIDADTMEIPNALPLWIVVLGILSFAFGSTATLPWYDHLIGAVIVSVPMLLLAFFIVGSFGMGDIKLIAAAGLLLGWQLVLVAIFTAILIGGAWGIYLLVSRKKGRKEHFAFGPALCFGIANSIFSGQQIINWYLGFF